MVKRLGYTFSGSPLLDSGMHSRRRNSSFGRKRKPSRFLRFYWIIGLALILFAVAAAVRKAYMKEPAAEPVPPEEPAAVQPEPAVPETLPEEEKEHAFQPEPTVPETPQRELDPEMNRQALRVFSAAGKSFQRGRYEDARKALRVFIEHLSVPVTHPLYPKACDMLGQASFHLLNEGQDPADFLDYEVKAGDSLARLAKKYGTGIQEIMEASGIERTALKIGQKLRIPLSTWSMRIDRENSRVFLDKNGRLFKVYPVQIGELGRGMKAGLRRVASKKTVTTGDQTSAAHTPESSLLVLNSQNAEKPVIGAAGGNGAWFSMSEADIREIFRLLPKGTPVEILEKH